MSEPHQTEAPGATPTPSPQQEASSPLRDAIRRIRVVQTDQADGLSDLRDAERARLELLADDLASLIAEVPDDIDVFAFSLTSGETPRLWIDMTCHVGLGRDRRTYRLLKDTRVGRTVLHETADRAEMASHIADYVAERMIDRERAIEGDWVSLRRQSPGSVKEPNDAAVPLTPANEDRPGIGQPPFGSAGEEAVPTVARGSRGTKWVALALGILIGAGGLAGAMMFLGRL